ncbi:MAG: aminotransferase class I/II-fold pyridoxal phosphate-dependent enzyme [Calditrichaeota bacterium]|nr:aminotransferase class I/II-fold pyridoxal phosphate-dependent enzyme [Calditrichota bacterium]
MPQKNSPAVNLNLNVRGLPLSATLRINEISNQMIREGKHVFKLGLGQSPFPVPAPVEEELKANAFQKDYLPVLGLSELRKAISAYFARTQAVTYGFDNIMVGPGSKELMFILQLVYYGDLVIPTPSWVSYAPQAHIIGRPIRWLPTKASHGWRLSPQEIENVFKMDPERPRLLILNYPNNPHGSSYSTNELREIARIAKKYRVVLLSDEIYGELKHNGEHISIARFYPEGTIISSGLSKWCGAGGWRLGVFAFPESLTWLKNAMAAVASETFTSTSAPIQYAAVRAFEGGREIEDYLFRSRMILKALGKQMVKEMTEANIAVNMPDGAFYLFPDFSHFRDKLLQNDIENSEQLCERLLSETGIAILPGSAFGRPPNELTARLSYVDFDGAKILTATHRFSDGQEPDVHFLEVYAPNCIRAIRIMVEWLKKL